MTSCAIDRTVGVGCEGAANGTRVSSLPLLRRPLTQ
jgi:hypothetical protein